MTLPILYSFRRCPYAIRARMALDVSGTAIEHREVLLRDKPASMLEASPKGTVPVLVLPDNTVIDESIDVMIWALIRHDPENWLASKDEDVEAVQDFLAAFKDRLDRYKYASRYDETRKRGDVDLAMRAEAMSVLNDFTASLSDTKFLRRNTPQLIDIASFPFVRQFAAVEPEWWSEAASQELQNWLKTLVESDRFKRIMKKYPLWGEDNSTKEI
ncbi:MAG: glutathione S-transferase N-terminal domain-containing protein [Pseudomonadota bacterium]